MIFSSRLLQNVLNRIYVNWSALAGEEQGLFGGKILAEAAQRQGWRLKAVLNNDMIGNITGINGVINNTTARIFAEGPVIPKQMHKHALAGIQVAKSTPLVATWHVISI
jgi:hypothetical protein